MSYNDPNYNALQTQRASLRSALATFVTSTLPATVASVHAARNTLDPEHPMLDSLQPEDVRFYRACVEYLNSLRAQGRTTVAAFPYP